jgi:mono/diheme cytochrome c family protein
LPVSATAGDIDEELAERGEELFETKGCIACHTIGNPVGGSLLAGLGRGGLIACAVASLAAWTLLGFAAGLAAFARISDGGGRARLGIRS